MAPSDAPDRELNTWKEIAEFFGRTTRTVQLWERERGLPVRRMAGQVYASTRALEAWRQEQEVRAAAQPRSSRRRVAWLVAAGAVPLVALLAALVTGSGRAPAAPASRDTIAAALGLDGPSATQAGPRHQIAWIEAGERSWVATCDRDTPVACRVLGLEGADGELFAGSEARFPRVRDRPLDLTHFVEPGGISFPARFDLYAFRPFELDGDPATREAVLVLGCQSHFPNYLAVLRLEDAPRVAYEYWNFGDVHPLVADLDEDGRDELLIHGVANTHNEALIARLHPREEIERAGRGPDGPRDIVPAELASLPVHGTVLLVPPTALGPADRGEPYTVVGRSPGVDRLAWNAERRILTALVTETYKPRNGPQLQYRIRIGGDGSVAPVELATHDAYLVVLQAQIGAGRLEDLWGIARTERLTEWVRTIPAGWRLRDARDSRVGRLADWRAPDDADPGLLIGPADAPSTSEPPEPLNPRIPDRACDGAPTAVSM